MSRAHSATAAREAPDLVIGTTHPVSGATSKRTCRDCGRDVFTSQPYPADIPIICLICFAALPNAEIGGTPSGDPDELTDAQLLRLCMQHDIRDRLSFPRASTEARRRGVDIHVVIREHIIKALKDDGIL